MRRPIIMDRPYSVSNFSEQAYLSQHADVREAIAAGAFSSAAEHFVAHGAGEGRMGRATAQEIGDYRREKLGKLASHLRDDLPFQDTDGVLDFLTPELRAEARIVDTINVSANGYDDETIALIESCADGLVLDCGAGKRDIYFHNVVNYEIVKYDTTDVVGVGEVLPFTDDTFDAVISIAVLEHVRDPFRCAREIARVLKPGGKLLCAMPFLQPLQDYPHHYFNATKQGIARLFEDDLTVETVTVPDVGHPTFALHSILSRWLAGLDAESREMFGQMKIADIAGQSPISLKASAAGALPQATIEELACGFVVRASKA